MRLKNCSVAAGLPTNLPTNRIAATTTQRQAVQSDRGVFIATRFTRSLQDVKPGARTIGLARTSTPARSATGRGAGRTGWQTPGCRQQEKRRREEDAGDLGRPSILFDVSMSGTLCLRAVAKPRRRNTPLARLIRPLTSVHLCKYYCFLDWANTDKFCLCQNNLNGKSVRRHRSSVDAHKMCHQATKTSSSKCYCFVSAGAPMHQNQTIWSWHSSVPRSPPAPQRKEQGGHSLPPSATADALLSCVNKGSAHPTLSARRKTAVLD